jgi:hypothetical protein
MTDEQGAELDRIVASNPLVQAMKAAERPGIYVVWDWTQEGEDRKRAKFPCPDNDGHWAWCVVEKRGGVIDTARSDPNNAGHKLTPGEGPWIGGIVINEGGVLQVQAAVAATDEAAATAEVEDMASMLVKMAS